MKQLSGVILCTAASIVLVTAGILLVLPRAAGAFWPFAVTNAAGNTTVQHDPSLNLLVAPLSTNIDDVIDGTALTTPDGTALVPGGDVSIGNSTSTDQSAQDILTTPSSGTISQYTVKSGDSLSQIAQNFGVSQNTILWANNIKDPSTIKKGTVLVILPVSGVQHTVRSGETLSSIATKFGADASDIAQFNGISATDALVTGSDIIIPGGELTSLSTSSAASVTKETSKTKTQTASVTKTTKAGGTITSKVTSTATAASGVTHYSVATGNPYKGGSGASMHGFFTNPLPGALLTQSVHGWNAVDLGAHTGTPILAAASGKVILSRTSGWNGGYGNYVIIDNGSGVETLYSHMSQNKAVSGDTVSAGEVIGYVGMTGDATGPHLHFEVRGARNPFASCVEMEVCSPSL